MLKRFVLLTILTMSLCLQAIAGTVTESVHQLQQNWAVANYQLSGKDQKEAFESLLKNADAAVDSNKNFAEIYIWRAIIESTYAGVKGGIGALKYAKLARKDLEHALSIDASALQGSAYTSLGTLYFKVPGWPIGFGDKEKARELLKKALAINPEGIDANYFYGEFLRSEKLFLSARDYLETALHAEDRPGRALADEGRRKEIRDALSDIENHL